MALGRFDPAGNGVLDPATADLSHALPAGVLFLDGTLPADDRRDGLGHPAAATLHAAWAEHGPAIGTKRAGLREWLALDFFKDVHKGMYENRPIHWPLSSEKRTFVAWVNIHRMDERTLRILLADHLVPTLARLDGELADLRAARDGVDKKASRAAEKDLDRVMKAKVELEAFIAMVEQCADRGAPPVDAKSTARERDARYVPDLDDGVMINAAGLWPLLEPQWKDPKKWWKELSESKGKKDYDWAHLARRYWPARVDAKCQEDPSLGVAHGCFWRYHPERAWAWELRLQDEIGPDFRIEERPYDPRGESGFAVGVGAIGVDPIGVSETRDGGDGPHREAWLREHPEEALAAVEKEATRRMGRGKKKKVVESMALLERGLWERLPAEVWAMELRLSEKQGVEFRLTSPDEPEARASYEAEHPEEVARRAQVMASLVPPELDLDDDPEDEDADASDDDASDDGDES
ncbi:MAG: hypothetical protein H6745_25680 [Deltaproteobacteria bacterium]|nr:hypothetical protein [Deltaproteobacteria bacterium]